MFANWLRRWTRLYVAALRCLHWDQKNQNKNKNKKKNKNAANVANDCRFLAFYVTEKSLTTAAIGGYVDALKRKKTKKEKIWS